jgi:hypothetical protein
MRSSRGVLLLEARHGDGDLLRLVHHVLVGEDAAVGADDHAGARHLVAPVVELDDRLDVHDRRFHAIGHLDDARLQIFVGGARHRRAGEQQRGEGGTG